MPAEMFRERNGVIEKWMLTSYRDGGIERFDALHIDKIDEIWGDRSLWVQGGLQSLLIAVRLRECHELPVKIALTFSLKASDERTGIDFRTREEFAEKLDWTPPSLYLFRTSYEYRLDIERAIEEGHVSDDAFVEEFNSGFFGQPEQGQRCLYMEFRRKEEVEYCRSVSVEA